MARETTDLQPIAGRIRGYFTGSEQLQSAREESLIREERRRERVRIARELHDTLLQGLLSATLQLQVVEGWLPPDSPARPLLSRVRDLMRKGIDEGRAALQGLRSAEIPSTTLDQALSDFQDELTPSDRARLRIAKFGRPKLLEPAVLQQIFLIAREATLNSLRHSLASKIEVEVQYSPRNLRVVVRDNGSGIDQKRLNSGPDLHWGLTVMRERAANVGARLRIWTKPNAGTEVILSLPFPR